MPLMLFLAVFARETIFVVLGEKWLPATNILWIMAMTSFIEPAISTVGAVLLTSGNQGST
jgi:PST family polysaccharide transporter